MRYFGCLRKPGHHLFRPDGRSMSGFEARSERWPEPSSLDANPLLLPIQEQAGRAICTYLPAINVTVLAWWGSPFDSRPKVNSAVLIRGLYSGPQVWEHFCSAFRELAEELTPPEIVVDHARMYAVDIVDVSPEGGE